jgi:hypothetical protein
LYRLNRAAPHWDLLPETLRPDEDRFGLLWGAEDDQLVLNDKTIAGRTFVWFKAPSGIAE